MLHSYNNYEFGWTSFSAEFFLFRFAWELMWKLEKFVIWWERGEFSNHKKFVSECTKTKRWLKSRQRRNHRIKSSNDRLSQPSIPSKSNLSLIFDTQFPLIGCHGESRKQKFIRKLTHKKEKFGKIYSIRSRSNDCFE